MPIRLIEVQKNGRERYRVAVNVSGVKKETTVTGSLKDAKIKESEFLKMLKKETGCTTIKGTTGYCKVCKKPFTRKKPDHIFCSSRCNSLYKEGFTSIYKKCLECGDTFKPGSDYRECFCSDTCKTMHKNKLKLIIKGKTCIGCGHVFKLNKLHRSRVYCYTCRPARIKRVENKVCVKNEHPLLDLRLNGILYMHYGCSGRNVELRVKKMTIAVWLVNQMLSGNLSKEVVRHRMHKLKSCRPNWLFLLVADEHVLEQEKFLYSNKEKELTNGQTDNT